MKLEYGNIYYIRYYCGYFKWIELKFRIDSVPIGSKKLNGKQRFYAYHKRPKTAQEKRWSIVYPKFVRSRRNLKNIPSSWDDLKRGDCNNRKCWKNKKVKKQWMKSNKN